MTPLRESIDDVVKRKDEMGVGELSKRLVQIQARRQRRLAQYIRRPLKDVQHELGTEPPTPSQLAGKTPLVVHVPIWRRKWIQIRLVGSVER